MRKCLPVPLCGTLLWQCWPVDSVGLGASGQHISPPAVEESGRAQNCKKKALEDGCFSKPGQMMTGGLLRAAPHKHLTLTRLLPLSHPVLVGALCMPAQPRVRSGKAMSMVEEGSLSPSLPAGAVRGEDWAKSSNRATLTKLRVVRASLLCQAPGPPEE